MKSVKHYLIINDFNFNPDIETGSAFEVVEKIKEDGKIKYVEDEDATWKMLKNNRTSFGNASYWLNDSDLKKLGLNQKSYNVYVIDKHHLIDDLCEFAKSFCIDKVNDCFFGESK